MVFQVVKKTIKRELLWKLCIVVDAESSVEKSVDPLGVLYRSIKKIV